MLGHLQKGFAQIIRTQKYQFYESYADRKDKSDKKWRNDEKGTIIFVFLHAKKGGVAQLVRASDS